MVKFVRLVAGGWFSMDTLVSSTNKTDHHDITEILLKVALNTITLASISISSQLETTIPDGAKIGKNAS